MAKQSLSESNLLKIIQARMTYLRRGGEDCGKCVPSSLLRIPETADGRNWTLPESIDGHHCPGRCGEALLGVAQRLGDQYMLV